MWLEIFSNAFKFAHFPYIKIYYPQPEAERILTVVDALLLDTRTSPHHQAPRFVSGGSNSTQKQSIRHAPLRNVNILHHGELAFQWRIVHR